MPIYEIKAPNGKTYSIEGPAGATREEVIAQILSRDPSAGSPPEQEGFFSSVGRAATALKELPASLGYGVAATPEEEAARRKKLLEEIKPEGATTSFEDVISGPGKFTDWVKQIAGSSLGALAAPATAAVGARIAGAPSPVAKGIGFGTMGLQYLAENLQRQAQEREKAEVAGRPVEMPTIPLAGAAAAGQTALDVVGFKYFAPLFSRFPLLRNLAGEAGEKATQESVSRLVKAAENGTLTYTGGIAKGFAKGMAFEIPQEVAQQVLERWQAGADLFDEEARKEYLEAAAGAAVLGGPMGAVGSGLDVRAAKAKVAEKAAAEKATAEAPPAEAPPAEAPPAGVPPVAPPAEALTAPPTETKFTPPEDSFDRRIYDIFTNGYRTKEIADQLSEIERLGLETRADDAGVEPSKYIEGVLDKSGYIKPERAKFYRSKAFKDLQKTKEKADAITDVGADGGGADVAVSGGAPEGPRIEEPKTGAVAGVGGDAGVPAGGKGEVATALAKEQQDAVDFIAAIDKGGVPLNPVRINEIARNLGLEVKTNAKPEETISRIREAVGRVTPTEVVTAPSADAQAKVEAEADAKAAAEEAARVKAAEEAARVKAEADAKAAAEAQAKAKREEEEKAKAATATQLAELGGTDPALAKLKDIDFTKQQGFQQAYKILNDVRSKSSDIAVLEQVSDIEEYLEGLPSPKRTSEQEAASAAIKKVEADYQAKLAELGKDVNKAQLAALNSFFDKVRETVRKKYGKKRALRDEAYRAYLKEEPAKKEKTTEDLDKEIADLYRQIDALTEDVKAGKRMKETVAERRAREAQELADTERAAKERAQEAISKSLKGKVGVATETLREQIRAAAKKGVRPLLDYLQESATGLTEDDTVVQPLTKSASIAEVFLQASEKLGRSTLYQNLARTLAKVTYGTKVVLEENNEPEHADVFKNLRKNGDFGAYYPGTDTIYLTSQGMNERTLLHELVHAATTKLIYQYQVDPSKLTASQREAIEHLYKILDLAKKRLGAKYGAPLSNIYEFVSYAMTDAEFQADLAKMRSPSLALYTKGLFEDLWSNFTAALARLFGLSSPKGFYPKGRGEAIAKALRTREERIAPSIEKLARLIDPSLLRDKAAMRDMIRELAEYGVGDIQYTQDLANALGQIEYGYEGNLALEIAEAFENIIAPPEAIKGFEVKLPAKAATIAAAPVTPEEQLATALEPKKLDKLSKPNFEFYRGLKYLWSRDGYEKVVTAVQNDRAPLKYLQEGLELAGKLVVGVNDIYNQIVNSSGKAAHNMKAFVDPFINQMNAGIESYRAAYEAKLKQTDPKAKFSRNEALQRLSRMFEAMHEPERRHIKWLLNAPIKEQAANRRLEIVKQISSNEDLTKKAPGKDITIAEDLRRELEGLVTTNLDENGSSPAGFKTTDEQHKDYRVIGTLDPEVLKQLRDMYQKETASGSALKDSIEQIKKTMKELQTSTIKLEKEANYWTQPVDNVKAFYNYQNYVPYKGKPESKVEENDGLLDLSADVKRKKYDNEYNSTILGPSMGRDTDADNVLIQSQVDGAKAAMRAARKGVSDAVRNLMGKERVDAARKKLLENSGAGEQDLSKLKDLPPGILDASLVGVIKFEDRYKPNFELPEYAKKTNVVFNFMEDGTIEVYALKENKYANALRRMWTPPNFIVKQLNAITSGVSQLHTRYNVAFPVMDFVRNALTNAPMIGAKFGGKYATDYINAVAQIVGTNGLWKAGRVEYYYGRNDVKAIQVMAERDPFIKDLLEYFEAGGRVTYIQGIALQAKLEGLIKDANQGNVRKSLEAFNAYVDVWMNSFEMTSRVAAYRVIKNAYKQKNPSATEEQVRAYAAAETKNLANFEEIGDWGKLLGGFFMFFRPAATGAVRAIDSIMPALVPVQHMIDRLPIKLREDPKAVEEYKKNYAKLQSNARRMILATAGAGAFIYFMALTMAGDDEMDRNKVATDEMSRWTRYMRLPLDFLPNASNKYGNFLQLPWGFGYGAFAAIGAQVASAASGNQPLGSLAVNTAVIGLDSFLPIPISRMDWSTSFAAAALDSITPSVLRPLLEFVMNKDALGREIYNNRQTPYGSSYIGSDSVPEAYKMLARWAGDTLGIEASPNIYYFFANNYFDGISRIGHNVMNAGLTLSGRKDFDAKTDLLIFDSYFGRKSNFDARQYAEAEKEIKKMKAAMDTRRNVDPDSYARYIEKHPYAEYLVDLYNKNEGGELKRARSEAKFIRGLPNDVMSPKEKKEMLDGLVLYQNIIKRAFLDSVKDFGVKP